jgi:type I restriction enzyme S subunit
VFEVIDHDKLDPEYLMMWFRRPEFDRYARYKSHGSVREMFDWEEMCEVELPVPSIEKQREIVREYNTVSNRIKLNEELNRKLEETAQAIYKHWFVDFEFPNISGLPYKSSGGKMLWNEELEKEIPVGWRVGKLGDLCEYSNSKIAIGKINISKYISTDNMLPHKRGIEIASSLPNTNKVVEFRKKDILLSNIRPYFKKIYFADFDGGCSNDVLCIRNKLNISNFLYFTIEQDIFFEYVMAGSKGTKMPRGDKNWIMKYSIIIPEKSDIIKFETFTEGILNKSKLLLRYEIHYFHS